VAPGGRRTVRTFDPADPAGVGRNVSDPVSRGFSIVVTTAAAQGLVVERPEYFHRAFVGTTEINDGHDVPGTQSLSSHWAFAEGSTLSGFYPFLTVENPGSQQAAVTITYTPDDGVPVTRSVTAAPTSRLTVQVYGPPEQGGIGSTVTGFGIFVDSTTPVVVESPFYVDRVGLPGLPEINGGFRVAFTPDHRDLLIFPGRLYIDGLLCEIEEATRIPITHIEEKAKRVHVRSLQVDGHVFQAGQWVELLTNDEQQHRPVQISAINTEQRSLTFHQDITGLPTSGLSMRYIMTYTAQPLYPNPPFVTKDEKTGLPEITLKEGSHLLLVYLDVWRRQTDAVNAQTSLHYRTDANG